MKYKKIHKRRLRKIGKIKLRTSIVLLIWIFVVKWVSDIYKLEMFNIYESEKNQKLIVNQSEMKRKLFGSKTENNRKLMI